MKLTGHKTTKESKLSRRIQILTITFLENSNKFASFVVFTLLPLFRFYLLWFTWNCFLVVFCISCVFAILCNIVLPFNINISKGNFGVFNMFPFDYYLTIYYSLYNYNSSGNNENSFIYSFRFKNHFLKEELHVYHSRCV